MACAYCINEIIALNGVLAAIGIAIAVHAHLKLGKLKGEASE